MCNTLEFFLYLFVQFTCGLYNLLTFIIGLIRKPLSLIHQIFLHPFLQPVSKLHVFVYKPASELLQWIKLIKFNTTTHTPPSLRRHLSIKGIFQRYHLTPAFSLISKHTPQISLIEQIKLSTTFFTGIPIRVFVSVSVWAILILRTLIFFIIVLIRGSVSSIDLVEILVEIPAVARLLIGQSFPWCKPSGKLLQPFDLLLRSSTDVSSIHG